MGVDLQTYRGRVGIFKFRRKLTKQLETSPLTIVLETYGAPEFIKEQLVRQGIHPNPGPAYGTMSRKDGGIWREIAIGCICFVVGGGVGYWAAHYWNKGQSTQDGQPQRQSNEQYATGINDRYNKQAEIKKIHYNMINKLSSYLVPSYAEYWEKFCSLMCSHLGYAEVHGNNVTHVNDIFEKLRAKGTISYGKYDKIVEDLGKVHVDLVEMVNDASAEINGIKNGKGTYAELKQQLNEMRRHWSRTYAELKQQLNDMRRQSQEAEQKKKRAHERMKRMKEQHAKAINKKDKKIKKLRQPIQSRKGTGNITQMNIFLNAFVAN